jgi:integrase
MLTPHDLRRAFAVACVGAGVPLVTLQSGLGHSSPRSVLRYAREAAELAGHGATAQLERHLFG